MSCMSCMSCKSCMSCMCVCVCRFLTANLQHSRNSKSQTKTPTAPVVEEAWQGQQLRWSSKANNYEATQDPWWTRGQPHEVGCVREAWKPGQRRSFQGTKAMGVRFEGVKDVFPAFADALSHWAPEWPDSASMIMQLLLQLTPTISYYWRYGKLVIGKNSL